MKKVYVLLYVILLIGMSSFVSATDYELVDSQTVFTDDLGTLDDNSDRLSIKFTASEDYTAKILSTYGTITGNPTIRMGIWNDSGSDLPGSLLMTVEGNGFSTGWNNLTNATGVALTNGVVYWLEVGCASCDGSNKYSVKADADGAGGRTAYTTPWAYANDGFGAFMTFKEDASPPAGEGFLTVNINTPADSTFSSNLTQNFSCSITDATAIQNLSLYIWNSTGDNIITNSTDLTGVSNSTDWINILPYNNIYKWNCLGYDAAGNLDWGNSNYTLTIGEVSNISISLDYPTNNTANNTADLFQYLVGLYYGDIDNCSLWTDFTGSWELTETNSSAIVNDTNYNTSYDSCYQETANVSTICGGLNTGTYEFTGTWNNPNNAIDGNWTSYASTTNNNIGYLYVDYTKPSGSLNTSLWNVYTGLENLTYNIPLSCWDFDTNKISFQLISDESSGGAPTQFYEISCWDSTWVQISKVVADSKIYEDSMLWNFTTDGTPLDHPNNNITLSPPFNTSGTYQWGIQCVSDRGEEFWSDDNFTLLIDVTFPLIIPQPELLNNETIVWNGTLNTQINYTDEREIYSIVTILENGSVITNLTNLGLVSYIDNISYSLGTDIDNNYLTTTVCDAHTDKVIQDINRIDIDTKTKGLTYVIRDRWLWFQDDYIRVYPKDAKDYNDPSTEKNVDRYNFQFSKTELPKEYETYVVESNEFIDVAKLQIEGGHLVIPTIGEKGYWIDFDNDEATKYVIRRISNTKVEIDVYGLKSKDIVFNSVGELNCASAVFYFGNLNPETTYHSYAMVNSNESIGLNINYDSITMSNINATLYYNDTEYYVGTTHNFTKYVTTATLPDTTLNTNVSLYWYIGMDGNYYNLTNYTQQIDNFFLDNCTNGTILSLNISYWNEKNSSSIDIDVSGTFNYTNNSITKLYTLSQTATNTTQICIYPNYTKMNGNLDIDYSSVLYPQRNYIDESIVYSNVTQQIKLYGLHVDEGIYANFVVVDTTNTIQEGVLGTMSEGVITYETEYSDGSGSMSFWEDPDETYTYKFTKTGCVTITESLKITTGDIRTVTMNCGGGTDTYTQNYSYSAGVQYSFTPITDLDNGTDYNFTFDMSSAYWTITSCNMYLRNSSGTTIANIAGTYNDTDCNATIEYNTDNLTTIRSYVIYTLNSSGNIYADKTYSIIYSYVGDFSLKHFLDDLGDFGDAGFNDFSKMFLSFIVIMIITAMVSYKMDIVDPEAVVFIVIALTWLMSYIGWLSLGGYYDSLINPPASFAFLSKYIIAILITLMGGGYIMKRHID